LGETKFFRLQVQKSYRGFQEAQNYLLFAFVQDICVCQMAQVLVVFVGHLKRFEWLLGVRDVEVDHLDEPIDVNH